MVFFWLCGPVSPFQILLNEANHLFYDKREFHLALEKYQECLTLLDFENPSAQISQSNIDRYVIPCLFGAAQCSVEVKQYYKAQKFCQEVLKLRSSHSKAKQLHGICCVQLGDYKSAMKAMKN